MAKFGVVLLLHLSINPLTASLCVVLVRPEIAILNFLASRAVLGEAITIQVLASDLEPAVEVGELRLLLGRRPLEPHHRTRHGVGQTPQQHLHTPSVLDAWEFQR